MLNGCTPPPHERQRGPRNACRSRHHLGRGDSPPFTSSPARVMADMAQGEQIEYAPSYGDRVYPGSDGTGPVGARRLCVVPAGAKCTRCRGTSRGRRVTCTSPASMPRRGQVNGGRARARRMGGAGAPNQL